MKLVLKGLIGGVIVQVSIFLLLLVGVLINIDKLMPNVAKAFVIAIMVTAPGIMWLVREGEPQSNHASMLALGILIDTLLYSLIVYVILLVTRIIHKGDAEQIVGPERG